MTTHKIASPSRSDKLAFYLQKGLNKAQRRYRMLSDGDNILVAVSGGKDSLTLLDLLHRRKLKGREKYFVTAAHIASDFYCGRKVPDEWLAEWCDSRGIPLVTEPIQVADEIDAATRSQCFICAHHRRKALFTLADRLGCNKVAFGHHADDMAETTLMNLLYSGRIDSMDPVVSFFGGKLIVIRPLVLIEERDIADYVHTSGYPIQGRTCPEGRDSRRAIVKRLLREVEQEHRDVKRSMYHAIDRYRTALARVGLDPKSANSAN